MTFELLGNLIKATCGIEDNSLFRRAGFSFSSTDQSWYTPFARVAEKAGCPALLLQEKKIKEAALYRDSFAVGTGSIEEGCPRYPYQSAGVIGMINRGNSLNSDDMGLGKTIQAIGAADSIHPTPLHVLIVCPASLKINWLREWREWSKLKLSVGCAEGSKWPDTDVVIINYDILHKHSENLRAVKWCVFIADEAHYLKNPDSARSRQVYGNKKRNLPPIEARFKWFLTGTPILNRPIEIYPIIKYLSPYAFPDKFKFGMRYCEGTQTPFGWDFSGAKNLDELQILLRSSVMIRRTKAQVLTQLPAKQRQVIEIPNGEKPVSKKILSKLFGPKDPAKLTDQEFKNALLGVGVCSGAAFEEMAQLVHETAIAKIPACIEHLTTCIESNAKTVFFCHHKAMVDAVMEAFPGISVRVTGQDSGKEKQKAVDAFQNNPSVKLFVGNIKAAGVGLTLTAASLAVFGERTWVPGEMLQAEDRIHRIGQVNQVLIQHLVLADSIDAYMARAIVCKMNEIEQAQDNAFGADLTRLLS